MDPAVLNLDNNSLRNSNSLQNSYHNPRPSTAKQYKNTLSNKDVRHVIRPKSQ